MTEKEKEKMEILYEDLDKENKNKKTKSKSIIIYSLIGLLLIGLTVFLILFLKKKGKNNKPITNLSKESFKNIKTPFYFYNTTLLEKTISTCLSEANKNNIKIHFSLKSNFNEKILEILSSHKEIGADCVSGGEVNLALKYFKPEEVVFAGIGKTDEEIASAVDNNIFCINVESLEELENLNEICKKKKKR